MSVKTNKCLHKLQKSFITSYTTITSLNVTKRLFVYCYLYFHLIILRTLFPLRGRLCLSKHRLTFDEESPNSAAASNKSPDVVEFVCRPSDISNDPAELPAVQKLARLEDNDMPHCSSSSLWNIEYTFKSRLQIKVIQ